jgi:hypothetical protein
MLKEIPSLISVFGAKGFLALLESGAIRVVCDAMTAGQAGQTEGLKSTIRRGGSLPLGSYRLVSFGTPGLPTHRDYVSAALQEIHKAPISLKEAIKIKSALVDRLVDYSPDAGEAGVRDTNQEILSGNPAILEAIRLAILKEMQRDTGDGFEFSAEDISGDGDIRIVSDLASRLDISNEQQHQLIERAILAVAGMNQRIHLMESFGAVTGFQQDEVPVFERKLSFLMSQLNPDIQEQRLERVITIGNLPGFSSLPAGTTIDAKRLLKLRNDPECHELRNWLRNIDTETDEEINSKFDSLRERMSWLLEGPGGKTARFLITSGAGAIPVAGLVAGPALTAADSFLLERLIGKPGPAVFLSKRYPSIFKEVNPSVSLDELLKPME